MLSRKGLTEKVTSEQKQYRRRGEEPLGWQREPSVQSFSANEAGAEPPGVSEEGVQGRKRGTDQGGFEVTVRHFPLNDQEVTGGLGAQELAGSDDHLQSGSNTGNSLMGAGAGAERPVRRLI